MHNSVMEFVAKTVLPADVTGKRVLEVGSYDVNGSVRPLIERFSPVEYIGTDMREGPGVDYVIDVNELWKTYGSMKFDLVLCCEVMEHVDNWRGAITNMKGVMKPGGLIVVTTRSIGFPLHEHPGDYWRYSVADMCHIFADFDIQVAQSDWMVAGVFFAARKRPPSKPRLHVDLEGLELYAMPGGR